MEDLSEAYDKLYDKLMGWVEKLILNLPNLIIALVVLAAFWYLSRVVYRVVHRLTVRAGGNLNVADLLGSIMRVVAVGIGLFIALSILDLSQAVTTVLTGAGIVGLAIGFALQDPLANLFSGVMLSVKELYGKGDLVETNGFFGKIERITLRSTIIRSLDGQEIVIPNKEVLQKPLRNYSVTGERRCEFAVGVSYAEDLDAVAAVIREAVTAAVEVKPGRDVEVLWGEFGDSSINAQVRFWQPATTQLDYLKSRSAAVVAVKRAFDREDILIPFPIRTLDFEIKGGSTLADMLHASRQGTRGELAEARASDARNGADQGRGPQTK